MYMCGGGKKKKRGEEVMGFRETGKGRKKRKRKRKRTNNNNDDQNQNMKTIKKKEKKRKEKKNTASPRRCLLGNVFSLIISSPFYFLFVCLRLGFLNRHDVKCKKKRNWLRISLKSQQISLFRLLFPFFFSLLLLSV
ncbi:hypothetical protein, unlikely [Trypanosoma brucei brucei TREU927]|uniref:Uncharacterized protein n=1 Tax=Trypanosoma brucei brucei (strain 927/4 GUTat10.1) TaxID=185431 RepID=Q4GYV3_TRYB2|nr:hypothetical protein, unlikely [Trypanosoma brucei brucei TREU927]CAJ16419.1 hypothetical protein, unlikely [Trypanosoma brucei brucei TREU927]